jgi:hypothetical protein
MVSTLKTTAKNNQKFQQHDNITIDAKHNEMVTYFNNLNDSIPVLKEELKKLIHQYNIKDQTKKNDIEYILYKDGLREKITELKTKINSINNNEEMNKYYLNVGVLLHSYYENIENSKNDKSISENFEENLLNYENENEDELFNLDNDDEESDEEEITCLVKKTNVLNFFTNDIKNVEESNQSYDSKKNIKQAGESDTNPKKNDNNYTSMKISDFVKEEAIFKKKNILDEYLQKIDPNYVSRIKVDLNIFKCPDCKTEMTVYHSDGIQICETCGYQQNVLIESDKPSFKDPPIEVCYFSYRRINHYNELTKTIIHLVSTIYENNIWKNILTCFIIFR